MVLTVAMEFFSQMCVLPNSVTTRMHSSADRDSSLPQTRHPPPLRPDTHPQEGAQDGDPPLWIDRCLSKHYLPCFASYMRSVKIMVITVKGLKPAISYARDQNVRSVLNRIIHDLVGSKQFKTGLNNS